MNKDIVEGNWKQMRGHIKAWWGKLTNDDLDKINGQY
ncbi:MAG TPA: CsbD family protein, partial [Candidatus Tectomicrobia bacterium]